MRISYGLETLLICFWKKNAFSGIEQRIIFEKRHLKNERTGWLDMAVFTVAKL